MANNTLIQLPMMCARQGTLGFQLVVTFSCYHSRYAYVTKISNQADRHYPMTRSRVYENISRLIPTSLEKDLGLRCFRCPVTCKHKEELLAKVFVAICFEIMVSSQIRLRFERKSNKRKGDLDG